MKNISKSKVSTINIPIPTIEKQREIVLYVDSNNDIINQLQKEIENNKTIADMFLKEIVDKMNQSEVKEVIEDETEIILVEDDVKKSNIRPKLKKKQAFVVKKEEKYVEKEEEDNQSVISVVSRCSEFKCAYRNRKGETCSIKPRVNPNYCSKHSPKTKCYQ
jgi:restriction endonuclease S subunit